MAKYQVVHGGQILTSPLDLEVAKHIAVAETVDSFLRGDMAVCKVVIAKSNHSADSNG